MSKDYLVHQASRICTESLNRYSRFTIRAGKFLTWDRVEQKLFLYDSTQFQYSADMLKSYYATFTKEVSSLFFVSFLEDQLNKKGILQWAFRENIFGICSTYTPPDDDDTLKKMVDDIRKFSIGQPLPFPVWESIEERSWNCVYCNSINPDRDKATGNLITKCMGCKKSRTWHCQYNKGGCGNKKVPYERTKCDICFSERSKTE